MKTKISELVVKDGLVKTISGRVDTCQGEVEIVIKALSFNRAWEKFFWEVVKLEGIETFLDADLEKVRLEASVK